MATANWRTINIDLLDPDSSSNFDTTSLAPAITPVSAAEVQHLSGQIKQLLRGGDAEGALRGALENAPYGGDSGAKVCLVWVLLLGMRMGCGDGWRRGGGRLWWAGTERGRKGR